jgi:protein-L-isoaspartate(D-aspartate) O-methyltransferase
MFDFADARRKMIDCQLRPVDVTQYDLLMAMLEVPRERFVPPASAEIACRDSDIKVGDDTTRCLLRPEVLARLVQAAQIGRADRVLVVGCTTGYSAAVIARLAGKVVALENDEGLTRRARETLAAVDAAEVAVVYGPLAQGWSARAPYDVILVDGAIEVEPTELLAQLAEGGRLIAIIDRGRAGRATVYRRDRGDVSAVPVFNAAAPILPGFEKAAEFVF